MTKPHYRLMCAPMPGISRPALWWRVVWLWSDGTRADAGPWRTTPKLAVLAIL